MYTDVNACYPSPIHCVMINLSQDSGRWVKIICNDYVNTSVAEETFTTFQGFRKVVRAMRAELAVFYLDAMVESHNDHRTKELRKAGYNPNPLDNPSHIPMSDQRMGTFGYVGDTM